MARSLMKNILIVEDDEDLRVYLKKLLVDHDFAVNLAADGTTALKIINKAPPDLVVLDLGLPDISGETVCLDIKKNYPDISVVVLTAKSDTSDVVRTLNIGADDYISKPFKGEELIARIKVRFRAKGEEDNLQQISDLTLNPKTFEVKRGSRLVPLTQKEFELLRYLMANKGRVLTREMILNKVWLYSPNIESRVVDVYIGYLRKKIDSGNKKKLIQSLRGFGYTIKEKD